MSNPADAGYADSIAINRANWDERAPAHAQSPGYNVADFAADPAYLSEVVRFDTPRLGDIAGLRGVHLQCHIGTDTVSLARLGARMTGLDFSPSALVEARALAKAAGVEVDFVESDVYAAADVLPAGEFDLVFTGIGALCWLPDVRRWAAVVARLLKPGGRLFLREGHPMLWALNEHTTDGIKVTYPYFETAEPLVFDEPGTYVETETQFEHNVSHSWNHGLGEIVSALLAEGMRLTMLEEHDSVPWKALLEGMVEDEHGEWRLAEHRERVPMSYTLQAVRER
ncbi:SAM-dependent methyltransferase [Hamadaea flava]|uniref:Class I SAM-dependent methyltransferase n=1 Tax=Hamadaea flava TaxID=1742688 RepID=A0ABV8LZ12_9ACTN|nr:class I SAM-dependent methyltransferase [Hamadaea flava]MCP2321979.1 SAM-dependent methyltransferase [Hamadaea flava]